MKELIGEKFKRNKYGPSIWTDEVIDVRIFYEYHYKANNFTPKLMIEGTKGLFDADEIIILI